VGRVFFRDEQIYQFDLLPEAGHRRPAFINLQQYWVEQILVERCLGLPQAELRWQNKVVGVTPRSDRIAIRVAAPEGEYTVHADWLIVADGARSPIRGMLGLESEGQAFRDRFLIADVLMYSDFPTERWFWFDPPFHRHQSALLHRQADNVWRIDFQLGPDADPEEEKKPEKIMPRLRAMLGDKTEFDIEWASVYTFQCRRMRSFRHGRALFVGDSAHLVSPFGARGANSGIQDVDNLIWKLELVMAGQAPESLLDSYDTERGFAADENIRHSTRSTSVLSTRDRAGETFASMVPLGGAAIDAPVEGPRGAWLLSYLDGGFTLLVFDTSVPADAVEALANDANSCNVVQVGGRSVAGASRIEDSQRLVAARYDGKPGTCCLFRPDQHLCARWRSFDLQSVRAAIARATGQAYVEAMEAA
jgi:3-(3-hydroxy-phenyl)propionate hydroxylase